MAKRKTKDMVAYSGELEDVLRDALQDNLSPEAVACIARALAVEGSVKKASVQRELVWFRQFLIAMVEPEYNDILKELGL